jgi:hypothetical protein
MGFFSGRLTFARYRSGMRWISKPGAGSNVSRLAVSFVVFTALGLFFSIQFHLINHQLKAPRTVN